MMSERCSSAAALATLTTPTGQTSDLVFEGTVQQLQGELALTYKVTKELTQRPPTLVRRRKQLAMDDDAEELLVVAATCSLGDDKMKVLTDEPMCACVDVFDDDVRVHFVSPTNPELGGVCAHCDARRKGHFIARRRRGWWDPLPADHPRARERGCGTAPRPAFAGSLASRRTSPCRGPAGGRVGRICVHFARLAFSPSAMSEFGGPV